METLDRPNNEPRQATPGGRGNNSEMIATLAMLVGGGLFFWSMRDAWLAPSGFGLRQAIVLAGAIGFTAALITQLRAWASSRRRAS